MTSAALVILGADARSAWNRLRRGGAARRRLLVMVVSVIALGPFLLGAAFFSGFTIARAGGDQTAALASGFTALVVLIMGLGLSTVITAFFADRVLLLLVLAPVRPRDVFFARLASASLPAWLVGAGVLTLLAGYGSGSGAGPAYYAASVLAVVLTVFSAVSLMVAVLSFVLRVVPARRARDIANLVAALMAAGFYVGWYGILGTGGRRRIGAQAVQQATAVGQGLDRLPTAWPAHALAAWAAGDLAGAAGWFGLTVATSAVLLGLAWLAYRSAFRVGVGVYGEGGSPPGRRPARRAAARAAGAGVPATGRARPVLALAGKDVKTIRRDVKRLSGVLPSIVMAIAYPLVFLQVPTTAGGDIGFWVSLAGVWFVPFLLSTAIALPAIGVEGRGMQLLLLAGVSSASLLRAKLAYIVPAVTLLGMGGGAASAVLRSPGLGDTVAAVAAVGWLSVGMASIGVGAGAIAPNFEAADPRRAVRFEGGVIGVVADAGFGLLSIAALVLVLLGRQVAGPLSLGLTLAAIPTALAAAGVVAAVLISGARHLDRWRPGDDD